MKAYTLHVPASAPIGEPEGLERAVLVRDGFSWGAFLFTFLWFFAHRLWLAGFGVLALVVAVQAALQLLRLPPGAALVAFGLVSLLIGLEASSLRRWTLARRGAPAVDAVLAKDREEAEVKAFRRWLARRPPRLRAPASGALVLPAVARPEASPAIGLFPDAERRW